MVACSPVLGEQARYPQLAFVTLIRSCSAPVLDSTSGVETRQRSRTKSDTVRPSRVQLKCTFDGKDVPSDLVVVVHLLLIRMTAGLRNVRAANECRHQRTSSRRPKARPSDQNPAAASDSLERFASKRLHSVCSGVPSRTLHRPFPGSPQKRNELHRAQSNLVPNTYRAQGISRFPNATDVGTIRCTRHQPLARLIEQAIVSPPTRRTFVLVMEFSARSLSMARCVTLF
jgi:hypothetical protein